MVRITKILVLMMFVLAMVPFVSAETTGLKVTLVSQSPDPVEPGQFFDVKFKIENEGTQTKNDAIVKVIPRYPFSVYGGKDTKNIGKLRASSTGADAQIVDFRLKVDEGAVEGDTALELSVSIGTSTLAYDDDNFMIKIQTQDSVLDVISIKSEPSQVAPGETAKVTIGVKNQADSLLKDIKFTLDFESNDLPLAPYQSSSQRRIAQLKSGFQDSLTFQVIADPQGIPGLYKVPLTITYNDENGKSYDISDILAITIGDLPKVHPFIKKSTVLQAGSPGKITLGIANAGTTDVKFVELFLLESDDYQLVSTTNYYYIGGIDSDNTESQEIDVYVNKKVKELVLPVKIKYVDANNKEFQKQFDLKLNLYSTSQLKKFGLVKPSSAGLFVLLVIFLGGGYYLYRRYYGKAKKKQQQV